MNKKVTKSLFVFQRFRQAFEKWFFILNHVGQVQPSVRLYEPHNIELGEGSKIGECAKLYATPKSKIKIGRNSVIGTDTIIYAFNNVTGKSKSVVVGNGCQIGAKSVILQGTIVRNGTVIGAGSVLTEDTETGENELWVGVPARKKRLRKAEK